jgi:hypothetical protein
LKRITRSQWEPIELKEPIDPEEPSFSNSTPSAVWQLKYFIAVSFTLGVIIVNRVDPLKVELE